MPQQTKPEDLPAAVRFRLEQKESALEVACATLPQQAGPPYRIQEGSAHFESRDAFKAAVVHAGLSPAVAEDAGRFFNATARQLRALGFTVDLAEKEQDKEQKAA
jgi:hypothetical protein